MSFPPHQVKKTGATKAIKMKQLSPPNASSTTKSRRKKLAESISFVIKGKLSVPMITTREMKYRRTRAAKKEVMAAAENKVESGGGGGGAAAAAGGGGRKKGTKVKAVKNEEEPQKAIKKNPCRSKRKLAPETEVKPKRATRKAKVATKPIKKEKVNSNKRTTPKILREATKATGRKVVRKLPTKAKPITKKRTLKKEEAAVVKEELSTAITDEEPASTSQTEQTSVDPLPAQEIVKKEEDTTATIKEESKKPNRKPTKRTVKKPVYRKNKKKPNKMKLHNLWNAPKPHRVASLNAKAKVHCLYENESRCSILDTIKSETSSSSSSEHSSSSKEHDGEVVVASTRTLRSVPGLRAIGKHWDMDDGTFSSSDESSYEKAVVPVKKAKVEEVETKTCVEGATATVKKRRRNRTSEVTMDLKDMVVSKRLASLNAAAILAASYSLERRSLKSPRCEDTDDDSEETTKKPTNKRKLIIPEETPTSSNDDDDDDDKNSIIEVCATPNNKKVAVIVNHQDTDVTITGVYLNSTTRSTHHEGYCSIAGMQYRISATSHTQTAATAVATTETILQPPSTVAGSSGDNLQSDLDSPCKSYTPLGALSNMQPPGGGGSQRHGGAQSSGEQRQHTCSSAFSAPPQPVSYHHPHHGVREPTGYLHGFYQPAGPLITVPHAHGLTTQQQPTATIGKSGPPDLSPTISPLPPSVVHPPAPSSTGDSSDNEVIITSVTTAKDNLPPPPQQPPTHYRYGQYPPTAHHAYSYTYPPHHYYSPAVYPPHHDLCYSPNPYLPKYAAHQSYRRLFPSSVQQYYHAAAAAAQQDLYSPATIGSHQQSQQVVSTNPAGVSGSTFQPSPSSRQSAGPSLPPPPTLLDAFVQPASAALVEPYPPLAPPSHFYPSYGPAPVPSCYTHPPPTQPIPYLNPTPCQNCECSVQSCPKNGISRPLTSLDSKRSSILSIAKESVPLPPVASLALPLEPASATGPPSPARGSAGMPPPPSPAGATYQSGATPKIETNEEKPVKKARVGKAMVRNNIAAAAAAANTMLLMCHPPVESVKREVESPKENTTVVLEEVQKKEIPSPELVKSPLCQQFEEIQEPPPPPPPSSPPVQLKAEEKESSPPTPPPPPAVLVEEVQKKFNGEIAAENEPCVATVAENVKVKNMKRKVEKESSSSSSSSSETTYLPPLKRQKAEKAGGSYKNLIKKNTNAFKINNGKRKLTVNPAAASKESPKGKATKRTQKRKLSPTKNETQTMQKRPKTQTKPLAASNLHNSKQNAKESKEVEEESVEVPKKTKKTATAKEDNRTNGDSDVVVEDASVRTCKGGKVGGKKSSSTKGGKEKVECTVVTTKRKYNKRGNNASVSVVPQVVTKPRRSLQCPRWSNGWMWEGEPYEAKVFINSDEVTVVRKCYPRMRHKEGDLIEPRDCVLLKAGVKKNDLPFVAKVAALWESPEDGEMMMSLLWYYRPEHTDQGRQPNDQPDEVFASRHKDSNSVACIEDKCYVLTFNEYCRYRKNLRRLEEGIDEIPPCIPIPEPYPRMDRQPPTHIQTPADLVFFCRRVYDFRQKRIVKNPS